MGGDAEQKNAIFIIPSNIILRKTFKNPDLFVFESTGSISILDNYVDIDLEFFNH